MAGETLLDALKFFYSCEELSGTRIDSGPDGLDVPQVGSVGTVVGAQGLAIDGTGNVSNYLEAAHDDRFRVGDNPFTLSYWQLIPAGTFTTNHPAVAHWNSTAVDERGWLGYMRNANDRHTFEVSNDGIAIVRVSWTALPVVDTWEHIVAQHDPVANTIGISVNRGTFETAAFAGGIFANTAVFNLTAMRVSSFIVGLGDVDEVGAWDRLLDSDELDFLFGNGTPPPFKSFGPQAAEDAHYQYYWARR